MTLTYEIINTYPHDIGAFTQGLVYEDGIFYEGTGQYGESSLRKVYVQTGNVLKILELSDEYFGEGVAVFEDKIIQLTYHSNVGFVYKKESFELLKKFTYPTEGWGLTHNGKNLIRSDGSSILYFLDPQTYKPIRTLEVHDKGKPLKWLNELEYIDGEIYANVWLTDNIVRINPSTGRVTAWIDMSGLLTDDELSGTDVLNGIAYNPESKNLYITGKYWPKLFEIKLVPKK